VYLLRDFVVAPQTFLKPRPVATAPPLAVGDRAPVSPALAARRPGRPAVVAFLRHVGCPFAEATVRDQARLAAAHSEIDFLAVTHSGDAPSQKWCSSFGGAAGVAIVADPDRAHYAAWGVGLSDREHFAGKASLAGVVRLLDRGIHNRWASGSRWQAAATFAVDAAGIVRWHHAPGHAGDLPPLDDAVAALDAHQIR
jgi:hypothetical protein